MGLASAILTYEIAVRPPSIRPAIKQPSRPSLDAIQAIGGRKTPGDKSEKPRPPATPNCVQEYRTGKPRNVSNGIRPPCVESVRSFRTQTARSRRAHPYHWLCPHHVLYSSSGLVTLRVAADNTEVKEVHHHEHING